MGDGLLGRVIDGLGKPLDERPRRSPAAVAPALDRRAPPMRWAVRASSERVGLGVRALDALVPCGLGQRLGIFAGSGVGKSSLLGMIARSTTADVNVIALVGERGREVREFVERDLGDALARSVVVVATSDQPALVRIKAAFTATAIAEHFRDQGHNVMLMMDSVTRFAMAQREVGLAIGEPPATRGYTPCVFALLPRLLERAGTAPRGSITGALHRARRRRRHERADRRRGPLHPRRPHRADARRWRTPATTRRSTCSRPSAGSWARSPTPEIRDAGTRLRSALAAYREKEDLISIGAYQPGTDPLLDAAIAMRPAMDAFLRQPIEDLTTLAGRRRRAALGHRRAARRQPGASRRRGPRRAARGWWGSDRHSPGRRGRPGWRPRRHPVAGPEPMSAVIPAAAEHASDKCPHALKSRRNQPNN